MQPISACKHLPCSWLSCPAPPLAWMSGSCLGGPMHVASLLCWRQFSVQRGRFKETTRNPTHAADLPWTRIDELTHVEQSWRTALLVYLAHLSPNSSPVIWRKVGRSNILYIDSLITYPCAPHNKSLPFWKDVWNFMENHVSQSPWGQFLVASRGIFPF